MEMRDRHHRRRRQGEEEEEEGALGALVGGEGGVGRSQDPITRTVPVPLGPTVQVADEEARVENPRTLGRASVVPGSAGGGKCGRGGPSKTPVGCAMNTSATTSGSAMNTSASGTGSSMNTSDSGYDSSSMIRTSDSVSGCAPLLVAPSLRCALATVAPPRNALATAASSAISFSLQEVMELLRNHRFVGGGRK
jgi:hypothetical protein